MKRKNYKPVYTYQTLADKYGLSTTRIKKIVKAERSKIIKEAIWRKKYGDPKPIKKADRAYFSSSYIKYLHALENEKKMAEILKKYEDQRRD